MIKIDQDLEEELHKNWSKALEEGNHHEIKKVLCLLDNAQNTSGAFDELFSQSLEEIEDPEMIVLLLGSSSKHLIVHAQKDARAINPRFTQALISHLSSQNPEVLEWVLRTIEQYGAQSIRFKKEILKAKPGILAFMNPHKKNAKQIIELLEKRWNELLRGV